MNNYLSNDISLETPRALKDRLRLQLELIFDECKKYYNQIQQYQEMYDYLNACINLDPNSN